jgi:hypothetical protein
MAPRLKIIISSGSKKGAQIYYLFLSKKVLASKSPPGALGAGGRCVIHEHEGILVRIKSMDVGITA